MVDKNGDKSFDHNNARGWVENKTETSPKVNPKCFCQLVHVSAEFPSDINLNAPHLSERVLFHFMKPPFDCCGLDLMDFMIRTLRLHVMRLSYWLWPFAASPFSKQQIHWIHIFFFLRGSNNSSMSAAPSTLSPKSCLTWKADNSHVLPGFLLLLSHVCIKCM